MATDPATKLTTPEAAERVGLSFQQLTKLRYDGGGPPFFKIGRRIVYAVGDIDTWLASKQRTELAKVNPGSQTGKRLGRRGGRSGGNASAHAGA